MTKSHPDQVYFRPRNWGRFQGYQKRGPKWIKFYIELLDNHEFLQLTELQQAHLMKLWLLYARSGRDLPWNCGFLARQLNARSNELGRSLKVLHSSGFIELAKESVAAPAKECDKSVALERDRDRDREREDSLATLGTSPAGDPPGKQFDPAKQLFDFGVQLLASYGIKNQKARALIGKWRKVRKDPDLMAILLRAGETRRFEIVPFIEGSLRDQVKRPQGFADREREAHRERMEILADIGGFTNGQSNAQSDHPDALHSLPGGSSGAAAGGNLPKGGGGFDRGD